MPRRRRGDRSPTSPPSTRGSGTASATTFAPAARAVADEPGGALVRAERPHAPRERVVGGRGQPRCRDTRRQLRLVRAGSQRRRGRLFPRGVIVFLYVVVFRDLLLCKKILAICPCIARNIKMHFFYKTPVVIDPCRSNPMCKN